MGHVQNQTEDFDSDENGPLLGSRLGRGYGDVEADEGNPQVNVLDIVEYNRSRWTSIRVMYFSVFLGAVTFTITMSSLWPFLQVLSPSTQSSFLGWVVSSYSLGQLIASPMFGAWANWRNSSKEPLAVSLTMMSLSSVFYAYLQSMPNNKDYYMILARFLIGFSAGNIAVVRSYVSGATTVQERTNAMANLSMYQAIGFILGPVFQSIMVLVKYPGPVEQPWLHFNMYTAPALLAAAVVLVNLALLLLIFKEYRLIDDYANVQGTLEANGDKSMESFGGSNSHQGKEYKLDFVAVFSSIYLFFVVLFMFTVFETIGTPISMHMYAWSKSKATFYQGIILGSGGALSVIVFGVTKLLARKYSERKLLLIGFLICVGGYFSFIPWGHKLPPQGLYPIMNNSVPRSSEAIFALFQDILYDHKFSHFGKDDNGNANKNYTPFLPPHQRENHTLPWMNNGLEHIAINNNEKHSENSVISMSMETYNGINKAEHNTGVKGPTINISTDTTSTLTTQHPINSTITQHPNNSTTTQHLNNLTTTASTNSSYTPEGCPWQYDWCHYVPMIPLFQYLIASTIVTVGYPICNMLVYTTYSKVLGPKPQGLWMGWMSASGSFARTVGPIYVSQIYDSYGPQVTYGSICLFIFLTTLFYLFVYRRLVPFSFSANPRAPLLFWRKQNRNSTEAN